MRRGEAFMLGLNILYLIAIVLIFWKIVGAFEPQNEDEPIGARQTALLNTYSLSEELLLYLDTTTKYAAYEALAEVVAQGGTGLWVRSCEPYATYESWTSPGQVCFPTTTEVSEAFSRELKTALDRRMQHPAWPRNIVYKIMLDRTSGTLKITGLTDDKISLPILYAPGKVQ